MDFFFAVGWLILGGLLGTLLMCIMLLSGSRANTGGELPPLGDPLTREEAVRLACAAGIEDVTNAEGLLMMARLAAIHESEQIIELLSRNEWTSLDHMPSEAALAIRSRWSA